MDMFHVIEDAFAIVRKPKGVYAQVKMYHRGNAVYIAYGSGFLRLGQKFGEAWGTSHPDIKVLDYAGPDLQARRDPVYDPITPEPARKIRAVK